MDLLGEHDLEERFPGIEPSGHAKAEMATDERPDECVRAETAIERPDVGRRPEHAIQNRARERLRFFRPGSVSGDLDRQLSSRGRTFLSHLDEERPAAQEQQPPVNPAFEPIDPLFEAGEPGERSIEGVRAWGENAIADPILHGNGE